jgi:DNA repair protein RadC
MAIPRGKRVEDLPARDRPRERLVAKGPEALSDLELVAVLLGSGTKARGVLEVAADLLKRCGPRLDQLALPILLEIDGVGQAKACQILAGFELARRHLLREAPAIREAKDVLPYVEEIRDKKQEYFICLSLSGANEVLASRVVTVGLLDSSPVHPREVFADPLADRAAAVIVAHNHPSGRLEPSAEDLALTERLARAGELLGIRLLDHLIVGRRGHVSLKESGRL